MSNKATLIMLIGLPASGKSTWSERYIRDKPETVLHSSDAIREELFGDIEDQTNNAKVFEELNKRVFADLRQGKTVIYDATNLSKRRRIAFIRQLNNINPKKIAVLFATPYEQCLARNNNRERVVPEYAMKKMYFSFEPPHFSEGWDEIEMIEDVEEEFDTLFDISLLFTGKNGIDGFDQKNKHHSETLGKHCRLAEEYIKKHKPKDKILAMAGLLHDLGKVKTQSKYNSKGVFDGNYHYYQHHCVGAYDSLFYAAELYDSLDDILRLSNLIFYHMHPYLSWKQSERAKEKDKRIIGSEMFDDILLLHDADVAAH